MSDELKSAVELALEKLDREMGTGVALSGETKNKIAEIRSKYRAKIAQEEITTQDKIRAALSQGDFAQIDTLQAQLAEVKRRLEAACEKEVAAVRKAESQ